MWTIRDDQATVAAIHLTASRRVIPRPRDCLQRYAAAGISAGVTQHGRTRRGVAPEELCGSGTSSEKRIWVGAGINAIGSSRDDQLCTRRAAAVLVVDTAWEQVWYAVLREGQL